MQFLKDNKMLIGGIAGIVILAYVYFTYFSGSPTALLTTTQNTPATSDLLITLASLHTITLDNSIFTDPAYLSLTDFGVTIPPENVGRPNPFAPLGAK
jgi:hypothetical protein